MYEDDDNLCYFVGGPADGKLYAMPKRLPEFRFPVFDELNYGMVVTDKVLPSIPHRAIYKHITHEIYWFVEIQ